MDSLPRAGSEFYAMSWLAIIISREGRASVIFLSWLVAPRAYLDRLPHQVGNLLGWTLPPFCSLSGSEFIARRGRDKKWHVM